MDKITFEDLVIEITRRCNMKCRHCFRGEIQEVDVDLSYVDAFLDQTELIGTLFITGGEPTLNLDAMEYIADGLCKRGIPILRFGLFTNGLIFSDRFIEIVKRFKEIVDISRSNCLSDGDKYQPQEEVSHCTIGISLDRYHEQQDLCMTHYWEYKAALFGVADVRKMAKGNSPHKIGRAKSLDEALNIDYKYDLSRKQRIEIMSKDHNPVCKYRDAFRMFHKNQKIVLCQMVMNVFGDMKNEISVQWDWKRADQYPQICKTSDSIWAAIQEYNKDKIPCDQSKELQYKILLQKSTLGILSKMW